MIWSIEIVRTSIILGRVFIVHRWMIWFELWREGLSLDKKFKVKVELGIEDEVNIEGYRVSK